MADVGGADAVVKQVQHRPIGTIHRLQRPLGPGPISGGEMGDVGIGVLHPGVGHQPGIDHQIGQSIDEQNSQQGELNGSQRQAQQHRQHAEIGDQHRATVGVREQGPTAIAEGGTGPEMGGGSAVFLSTGHTEKQV